MEEEEEGLLLLLLLRLVGAVKREEDGGGGGCIMTLDALDRGGAGPVAVWKGRHIFSIS